MKTAWVISIGTELTLGQSVDTNSAWISRRLASIGVRATRHVTIADDLDDIRRVLERAAERADVIIVTGGLGPTADDLTRDAVAAAAGVELVQDPASVEQLRAFFAARNRVMPESNLSQAMRPANAIAIRNDRGTAPGIAGRIGNTPVFVMPGVPSEMKAMFDASIAPVIAVAAGGRVIRSRKLNTIGLPESELGARIRDLMMRGRNPDVGTTADQAIIGVRINAEAASTAEADALIATDEAEIRRRLGDSVFGVDDESLAMVVGEMLKTRGETVATAESCTGGMIGALLTDVPGSSAYYAGGVVSYSNELKTALLGVPADLIAVHGAVSAAVAEAMVRGARDRFQTTYAVSVTGIAGPDGGSESKPVGLVFLGVASPRQIRSIELHLGADSSRDTIRLRSSRYALDAVRRELLRAGGV